MGIPRALRPFLRGAANGAILGMRSSGHVRRIRSGTLILAGVTWVALTIPAYLLLGWGIPGVIAGIIASWNSTSWATAWVLLPGHRGTVASGPQAPIWCPDRALRLAFRAMTAGPLAMSLYVVVGTWLRRIRIPDRLEIGLLIFAGVASLTGIGVARMTRMQVRADGSAFMVRGLFVAYRIAWRSIQRFEVRRGLLSDGLHVVLRDGTERRIPVLDPRIAPSRVDATGRHEMAARLNTILLAR